MRGFSIAVVILDPLWRRAVSRPASTARLAARTALMRAGEAPQRVAIALADDARVHHLNRLHRGKDRPTNVLAFPPGPVPRPEQSRFLGDVVLARGVVLAEADAQGKSAGAHLAHLVVHGVLHLLGYDHELPRAARIMEGLEVEILSSLGLGDPYRQAGGHG